MQRRKLTATICCILLLPVLATGQATRDTAAYQRIKTFLDSVPIIDTHEHLGPFERLMLGPGHPLPHVETERGPGVNLYSLWALSYYGSLYKQLTPWKPGQPFAEWWSQAKHDFDDGRALSQYRYLLPAFQDLYGIDFDSITDEQAARLDQRIFENYRDRKWLYQVITERANIELMLNDRGWVLLDLKLEHPFEVIIFNVAFLLKGFHPSEFKEPLLAIREKALGPEHPEVGQSLNNLAELYRAQGKYVEAEPLHRRALAIREKALGPEHPAVATNLNNLAELYREQGKYAKAEPLNQRALAIREKALGPEHPAVAASLNNLALLYDAQGKYTEAEPLYRRALAIDEKALGPEHPGVATDLNNLAELYRAQAKYAEAVPLYRRSLAILEKALGPEHPNVATSLENYAVLLRKTNRDAEAAKLEARAKAIRAKHAAKNPPK